MPKELKERLEPYFTLCVYSSLEYLNVVQQAFVKYKVVELKNTGQKLGEAFMCSVITEGIENRIWTEDFRPSAAKSLPQYLFSRMKNERRNISRQEIVSNTRQRKESLTNNQLSNISNPETSSALGE